MPDNTVTRRNCVRIAIIVMLCFGAAAAQTPATVRGQVSDQLGGVIAGASVTLISDAGKDQITRTDERGTYRFTGVRPGTYRLRVGYAGFATYERVGVILTGDQRTVTLDIKLTAAAKNQEVTVENDKSVGNNSDGTSIKGKSLDSLPDDPSALEEALNDLTGPAAGPDGAEIYIDGFSGDSPIRPDKQAIREIVVNRNPFSAEFDRIGYARIDVFTKPGTGKIHGGADFNFSDAVLNSRNPYADIRPHDQRRIYAGNFGGPLASNKSSFFFSANRRDLEQSVVINAIGLDDALNVTNIRQVAAAPETSSFLNPRVDFQLNKSNALRMNYAYNSTNISNTEVGGVGLPSVAMDLTAVVHQFNLTQTAVLNSNVVNESRFQYFRWERSNEGHDQSPQIFVFEAFVGGGAELKQSSYVQNEFELHNYTTVNAGQHTLRFGGRLRGAYVREVHEDSLAGTFKFTGRRAPELDPANRVVFDVDGKPRLTDISSIEAYRRTLLFQRLGLSPLEVRALGGGASQFLIVLGNPSVKISQVDVGGFVQDDWRLRPHFSLSFGLRYQNQTNARGNRDLAPRVAFAWTPWAKNGGQPKTVVRGGAGIFYDLYRTPFTLRATHLNGVNQRLYYATDSRVLDSFPNAPSLDLFESLPNATVTAAPDLRAPYSIQSSISIERSLAHNTILTATYLHARGSHLIRARHVNAPLPGTLIPGVDGSGMGQPGNVDQILAFESAAIYKQNLLIINGSVRPARRLSLTASYGLGYTNNDNEIGAFPANSHDVSGEYGRAAIDLRHKFVLNGTISAPWGISLNPFVLAQSGAPFDITTGFDNNNDQQFTDRPAFATDLKQPVRITPFGAFDLLPGVGARVIPRNFGQGPGYFSVNMRIGRTFTFGGEGKAPVNGQRTGQRDARPYKLTAGLYAVNIFNRTNPGYVIGDLGSPMFGISNSLRQIGERSPSVNRSVNLIVSLSF